MKPKTSLLQAIGPNPIESDSLKAVRTPSSQADLTRLLAVAQHMRKALPVRKKQF